MFHTLAAGWAGDAGEPFRGDVDVSAVPVTPERLGIVIVNWRRADDTIECLESALRASGPLTVVVVDNGSNDGSVDRIAAWAAGAIAVSAAPAGMGRLSSPPIAKPLRLRHLTAAEAAIAAPDGADVTLIDAGANLGFAAGNNLGLAFLLRAPATDYVWLLNNDTVIERDAATALIARMDATHRVGMCGTVVRYYHRPDTIQALNGHRFRRSTGTSRAIAGGLPVTTPFDPVRVARDTDFVLGASLCVSRAFVDDIGPMSEDYFLYFEEVDWAFRNAGRYTTAFAHGAIVYHKEGGSIGSNAAKGQRSITSDYYLARSRLRFVQRHAPLLLPWHMLLTVGLIGRRLLRGRPKKALALTRALLGLRIGAVRG